MGDLYHPLVPPEYRDQVFAVMAAEERHTFFLLTKRPGLMVHQMAQAVWPQNVWPGVSVESQEWAWRIDVLAELRGIAPVLWVSYEPALGAVDFSPWLYGQLIDLIVASGESGPKARPSHPSWFRKTRDDCVKAEVPFFFKGWGEWQLGTPMVGPPIWLSPDGSIQDRPVAQGSARMIRVGRRAGALLEGREWREMPQRCLMPQAQNEIVHASAT